ncbi:CIA30 family protein [Roseibacterium sp. SDUM158017]|uniref:CIA30 family protein n=1 Tax=Roseicyclus salinarum TaxID=3036773 RepID=UPI00241564F0|nr:CIA30 family protein [Roseibacterium sp. SDUM158017]MDG4648996.1 CIA30 family protein [Roseibacterium sp. SDUM158017]
MIPVTDASWTYLADTVMGGVSEGSATLEDGALRLRGHVSTRNRGGFIQTRTEIDGAPDGARGLRIRVRGNGEAYFIHLRTTRTRLPWQYYQARFETSSQWRDVTLDWADFAASGRLLPSRPRPAEIRSLGLVAYGRDHDADVSLSAFGWV